MMVVSFTDESCADTTVESSYLKCFFFGPTMYLAREFAPKSKFVLYGKVRLEATDSNTKFIMNTPEYERLEENEEEDGEKDEKDEKVEKSEKTEKVEKVKEKPENKANSPSFNGIIPIYPISSALQNAGITSKRIRNLIKVFFEDGLNFSKFYFYFFKINCTF